MVAEISAMPVAGEWNTHTGVTATFIAPVPAGMVKVIVRAERFWETSVAPLIDIDESIAFPIDIVCKT